MMNAQFLVPFLAAIAWGAGYALLDKLLHGVSGAAWLVWSSALWVPVGMLTGMLLHQPVRPWPLVSSPLMIVLALDTFACFLAANLLSYASIHASGAFSCASIEILYPIFIPLFSWRFFQQSLPGWRSLLGVGLVLMGIVVFIHGQLPPVPAQNVPVAQDPD